MMDWLKSIAATLLLLAFVPVMFVMHLAGYDLSTRDMRFHRRTK